MAESVVRLALRNPIPPELPEPTPHVPRPSQHHRPGRNVTQATSEACLWPGKGGGGERGGRGGGGGGGEMGKREFACRCVGGGGRLPV